MQKSPWINVFQTSPQAKLSLICFPYAGGGANIFATWKGVLPPSIEILAVNPPGRGARMMEPALCDMDTLVAQLKSELKPFLNKPYVFFGHSLGSVVAFEMARALRAENTTLPKHLFAAGRRAPHVENDGPPIYHLPDDAFKEEIRKKKGTPEEILNNDELMSLVLPMLKADFQIADTHQYTEGEPFDFPLTYYWGNTDKPANQNNDDAWGNHTAAEYRQREFQGGHFFIHSVKDQMLESLKSDLDEVLSKI
jgi:medium-chain acyl-[acyl-carrier-protein] hydrolase